MCYIYGRFRTAIEFRIGIPCRALFFRLVYFNFFSHFIGCSSILVCKKIDSYIILDLYLLIVDRNLNAVNRRNNKHNSWVSIQYFRTEIRFLSASFKKVFCFLIVIVNAISVFLTTTKINNNNLQHGLATVETTRRVFAKWTTATLTTPFNAVFYHSGPANAARDREKLRRTRPWIYFYGESDGIPPTAAGTRIVRVNCCESVVCSIRTFVITVDYVH